MNALRRASLNANGSAETFYCNRPQRKDVVRHAGVSSRQLTTGVPPLNASNSLIFTQGIGKISDAAVLAIDIVGYSGMSAQLPSDQLAKLLIDYSQIVETIVEVKGGRLVATGGDSHVICFDGETPALNAKHAHEAAIGIQKALAMGNLTQNIDVRMGIAMGEIAVLGERYAGNVFATADNLQASAPVGGIGLSAGVKSILQENAVVEDSFGWRFEDGPAQVKNIAELYSVGSIEALDDCAIVYISLTRESSATLTSFNPDQQVRLLSQYDYMIQTLANNREGVVANRVGHTWVLVWKKEADDVHVPKAIEAAEAIKDISVKTSSQNENGTAFPCVAIGIKRGTVMQMQWKQGGKPRFVGNVINEAQRLTAPQKTSGQESFLIMGQEVTQAATSGNEEVEEVLVRAQIGYEQVWLSGTQA